MPRIPKQDGLTKQQRYNQSEKGKASRKKYDQSPKGKASQKRRNQRRKNPNLQEEYAISKGYLDASQLLNHERSQMVLRERKIYLERKEEKDLIRKARLEVLKQKCKNI